MTGGGDATGGHKRTAARPSAPRDAGIACPCIGMGRTPAPGR
ncbi:hypothetical protein [Streptomyces sp. NPDC046978]